MSLVDLLTAAVLALAGATLLALLAMVVARAGRLGRERRRRRLAAAGTGLLVRVADGSGDQEALRQLADADAPTWKALTPTALHLLDVVIGQALADLIGLFERHGAIAEARRDLHSRSPVRRAQAAHDLGRFRHRTAGPELWDLLADPDSDVRHCAARALGRIGDPAAAPRLLAALGGTHPIPMSVVAHALLQLKGQVTPAVRDAIKDPDRRVREVAVEVLGRTGAYEALPDLLATVVEDESAEVRIHTVGALTRLGMPQAAPLLQEATHAPEPRLRAAAARALGELGDPRSAPRLTAMLADPDTDVAREAAQALPGLGPAGHAALEKATADPGSGPAAAQARSARALAARTAPGRSRRTAPAP